jgi:hypothetical protein
VIRVSERTIGRFEAVAQARILEDFVRWWSLSSPPLPPAPREYLSKLWDHGRGRAADLGIEDDERGQISLYAAATGLMGELDERQFLEVVDILFMPHSKQERLRAIIDIANRPRRAT